MSGYFARLLARAEAPAAAEGVLGATPPSAEHEISSEAGEPPSPFIAIDPALAHPDDAASSGSSPHVVQQAPLLIAPASEPGRATMGMAAAPPARNSSELPRQPNAPAAALAPDAQAVPNAQPDERPPADTVLRDEPQPAAAPRPFVEVSPPLMPLTAPAPAAQALFGPGPITTPAASKHEPAPAPVVRISIGRIDVIAAPAREPATSPAPDSEPIPAPSHPPMSLDAYLARRAARR